MSATTRRRLLRLLLSATWATIGDRVLGGPLDQGIGGTGVAPGDEADRGIGGTGVIGTIRKFGSIIVNDLRIAYPRDAEIRIDGQPASIADLRIGQVVRVEALGKPGTYSTRVIDVTSEVVGPVERIEAKQITVLGQTVSTASAQIKNIKVGQTIAVSGLRRNDETIVASMIERREGAPTRVSGPVRTNPDGSFRIGALTLSGVAAALVGRRAVLEGQSEQGRFTVTRGSTEASLLPASVRNLSIESYVERRAGSLSLGSGFQVKDNKGLDIPPGKSMLAVVNTSVGQDGQLTVDAVRTGGRPVEGSTGSGSVPKAGSSAAPASAPHDNAVRKSSPATEAAPPVSHPTTTPSHAPAESGGHAPTSGSGGGSGGATGGGGGSRRR